MVTVTPSPASAARPRVAISLLTLFPGGHGGGEVYAKETVARLSRDPELETTVHLPRNAAGWNDGVGEVLAPVVSHPSGLRRLMGMANVLLRSAQVRKIGRAHV